MIPKSQKEQKIPAETARIAKAAFPKGSIAIRVRDELGEIYEDEEFVEIYPSKGQPAASPAMLALVTVLQFMEGLTDRQAADAVRSRIDWKYALGMELSDAGFDFSILSEYRGRLIEGQAEEKLLNRLLQAFQARGLLKARSRQRTDSTYVLAAIRNLNRLELVGETLRNALNTLTLCIPDWVKSTVKSEWYERYGRRFDSMHHPTSGRARDELAQQIGEDGQYFLERIYAQDAPGGLSSISAVETLRQVWLQQYYVKHTGGESALKLRQIKDLPPSHKRIQSPYDIQAQYATHNDMDWIGYKVHITETCDEDASIHLITSSKTDLATQQDVEAPSAVHEALKQKGLLPSSHLVDAGYIGADVMVEAKQIYQIDLIGPATKSQDVSWQAREQTGFDASKFSINWEAKYVTCPRGKQSVKWVDNCKDRTNNATIHVAFARQDCQACPARLLCTRSKTEGRNMQLRPQPQYEALQHARAYQDTEAFKIAYRPRSGIEGTISQGVRAFQMRRTRYIGLAKTSLQNIAIAAAINLSRFSDYLCDHHPVHQRISPFATLAPAT